MAVDPMIARGVNPGEGIMGAIALAERIKGSREENELARMGMQMRQQQFQAGQEAIAAEQAKVQDAEEDRYLYSLIEQGDNQALFRAVEKASAKFPAVGQMFQQDPIKTREAILSSMRQQFGQGDQGIKIGQYNPGDYTPQSWAQFLQTKDPSMLARQYAPPAPPNHTVIQLPQGQATFNPRTGQTELISAREDQRAADVSDAAAVEAAKREAALGAERDAAIQKRVAALGNMSDALDLAVPLVAVATGSLGGAAMDRVAGAFGFTPSGAEATASLRVIASKVLENVPRMEGPQSDKDVKMYQEAAGQLGDPTVTRAEKMAAIRTIRQLTAKYEARNVGKPAPAPAPAGGLTPEEQAELEALRKRFRGQ